MMPDSSNHHTLSSAVTSLPSISGAPGLGSGSPDYPHDVDEAAALAAAEEADHELRLEHAQLICDIRSLELDNGLLDLQKQIDHQRTLVEDWDELLKNTIAEETERDLLFGSSLDNPNSTSESSRQSDVKKTASDQSKSSETVVADSSSSLLKSDDHSESDEAKHFLKTQRRMLEEAKDQLKNMESRMARLTDARVSAKIEDISPEKFRKYANLEEKN